MAGSTTLASTIHPTKGSRVAAGALALSLWRPIASALGALRLERDPFAGAFLLGVAPALPAVAESLMLASRFGSALTRARTEETRA